MAKPRKTDFFETSPWSALRRADKAVIEGYVDAARQWERIAEIAPSAHIDGRAAADFIVRAVTDHPIRLRKLFSGEPTHTAGEKLCGIAEWKLAF